jgi:hypothetical protein
MKINENKGSRMGHTKKYLKKKLSKPAIIKLGEQFAGGPQEFKSTQNNFFLVCFLIKI